VLQDLLEGDAFIDVGDAYPCFRGVINAHGRVVAVFTVAGIHPGDFLRGNAVERP